MKKSVLFLTAVFFGAGLFAQNTEQPAGGENPSEDEIELPDVTTVISGGAVTAGKEAVPDYKPILPEPSAGGLVLPKLGKVEESSVPARSFTAPSSNEQTVFAEGQLGGGFPFNFLGDFSIYRTTGNAPFAINFYHESNEGFGDKKAQDGFFERFTTVDASKDFYTAKGSSKFFAKYEMKNEGLQSNSANCTDEVWHSIYGSYAGNWSFNNGMYVKTGVNGDFYNRYGTEYADSTLESWEDTARTLDLNPDFGFGWRNKGFEIGFNIDYSAVLNLKETDTLYKAEGSSSAESSHRVEFKLNSSWEIEKFKVWADAAAVAGTAIGSNPVVVPFTAGIFWQLPSQNPAQAVSVKAEGGCSSVQAKIREIEGRYDYSVCTAIPVETTDWYGKINVAVPVKDLVALNLGADFAKTAFDNGVWAPDYEGAVLGSGYYAAMQKNRTEFNTNVAATMNLGQFKFNALWNAFWIDVPVLEEKNSVAAKAMYQAKSSKWSAEASVKEFFDTDADKTPEIGAGAAVRVSNSIRLAVEAKDVIKLCANKTRTFAHSKYEAKSGNLSLLVKFQF